MLARANRSWLGSTLLVFVWAGKPKETREAKIPHRRRGGNNSDLGHRHRTPTEIHAENGNRPPPSSLILSKHDCIARGWLLRVLAAGRCPRSRGGSCSRSLAGRGHWPLGRAGGGWQRAATHCACADLARRSRRSVVRQEVGGRAWQEARFSAELVCSLLHAFFCCIVEFQWDFIGFMRNWALCFRVLIDLQLGKKTKLVICFTSNSSNTHPIDEGTNQPNVISYFEPIPLFFGPGFVHLLLLFINVQPIYTV